jgi:hypothetical protein
MAPRANWKQNDSSKPEKPARTTARARKAG